VLTISGFHTVAYNFFGITKFIAKLAAFIKSIASNWLSIAKWSNFRESCLIKIFARTTEVQQQTRTTKLSHNDVTIYIYNNELFKSLLVFFRPRYYKLALPNRPVHNKTFIYLFSVKAKLKCNLCRVESYLERSIL